MKRYVQAALGCVLLLSPVSAVAYDCSITETHEVRIQYRGFFPSTLYACPGDTVRFVNKTGRTISFEIQDPDDDFDDIQRWTNRSNGSTTTYVIPSGYDYLRIGDMETSGSYNNAWDGYIEFQAAPLG